MTMTSDTDAARGIFILMDPNCTFNSLYAG